MKKISSRLASVVAAVVAALVVLGASACSSGGSQPTPSSTPVPSIQLPKGSLGAADFGKGYLAVGTGTTIVDVYLDPMCPYCGEFEKANGARLHTMADAGDITLRLHPLAFLDQLSNGSHYSTRASAALVCQATLNPKLTLDYLAKLYEDQPAENSSGRTDTQLVALATGLGGASIADCVKKGTYQAWVQVWTQRALSGPIPGADIPAIKGTPTVLVDGHSYTGDLTDTGSLTDFIAKN